jgi:ABC-type microcin C transport system permease subunit YejE
MKINSSSGELYHNYIIIPIVSDYSDKTMSRTTYVSLSFNGALSAAQLESHNDGIMIHQNEKTEISHKELFRMKPIPIEHRENLLTIILRRCQ